MVCYILLLLFTIIYKHVLMYHIINLPGILQHLNYHRRQHSQEDLHAACVEYQLAIMCVTIIRFTIQCINLLPTQHSIVPHYVSVNC